MSDEKVRKSPTIAIYDPTGGFFEMATKAVNKHDAVLYDDEKNVQSFLRLLIKNADICMEAIAKARRVGRA